MAYTEISELYERVFDRFENEDLISKAEVLQMIAAATLPAADIVEVVRCKDCEHYETHKPSVTLNCERDGRLIPMMPNDFCSYGKRKEGAAK